jgi:hypothetical protein
MALRRRAKPKSSRTIRVDMRNVGTGGARFRIEPGEYTLKCEEVTEEISKSSDEPMLSWIFRGIDGKAKGKTFYYHTSLQEQALWKLRETLLGLSIEVPEEIMDIDLDELEGLEGTAIVDDDEYQGRISSKIQSFKVPEDEEPEERPSRTSRTSRDNGRKPAKAAKVSEEEVNDMAEDDLESLIEKADLEVDLGDYKTLTKKKAAVIAALEGAKLLET